ncbi:MAG TPA: oligoribonuclease [Methylophilaceae bacterium]|nr:oligoribonuclease [Methylophilaceae bacterium]HBO18561.1 oligoribonuclease [Methylophilaceae bacterium]HCB67870.1 oligoribonuclease [Methylophilaceae bacterium]HCC72149.1 oligoribonuclease [Methylophilaceae bacterium]
MSSSDDNLIWLDMEMSGLNTETDKVLEVATVVTDPNLNIIAEGPVIVIHQSDEILNAMDAWNQSTHSKSGLIEKVKRSSFDEAYAEETTIEFLKKHIAPNKSPMCGNSICQDRRFMAKHMPSLENYFHYRNLDVSVFKELSRRWSPSLYQGFKKSSKHEALSDIYESIEELKYYREHFLKLS